MWITGFDVPSLTYMYNDKPLKKHLLIQTISRVNRKFKGKDFGFIIDYIGIRDNMREAMKIYGGDTSVAPSADDVEQATGVFREELEILKDLFVGYDLKPFLDPKVILHSVTRFWLKQRNMCLFPHRNCKPKANQARVSPRFLLRHIS